MTTIMTAIVLLVLVGRIQCTTTTEVAIYSSGAPAQFRVFMMSMFSGMVLENVTNHPN